MPIIRKRKNSATNNTKVKRTIEKRLMGCPQCGQAFALLLTMPLHALQHLVFPVGTFNAGCVLYEAVFF
jgi:hypothetical protein